MALNTGKILMRRGQEANFDPNKMMPGEWAVSLDSKYVRMCFSPGVCVRMATYEAFEADMGQIRQILAECQTVEEAVQRIYEDIKDVAVDVERIEAAADSALESEENALNSANLAVQAANAATQKASEAAGSANIASAKAEQATEGANTATQKASEAEESADNVRNMSEVSQSYAVGGTGTRVGEDTDNAMYYNQQASDNADRAEAAAERAAAVADVGVATTEKAGIVKPDGTTVTVDPDGTIHVKEGTKNYNDLENKPQIGGVELTGDQTPDELGLVGKTDFEEFSSQTTEAVESLGTGLERTTFKVDTIIEKADLGIKETVSGESIYLDDSADGKVVEFGLYGKAKQKTTTGKNLIPYPYYHVSKTENGVTFKINNDSSITINGTATAYTSFALALSSNNLLGLEKGVNYKFSKSSNDGAVIIQTYEVVGGAATNTRYSSSNEFEFSISENAEGFICQINVQQGVAVNNITVYPMIRLASITDNTWEPYTGGIPSPNPDYPQDIEIAGESGSVEVKSVGKNLLKNAAVSKTVSGVTFTVNKDGSTTANGTATQDIWFQINKFSYEEGKEYIFSGCVGGSDSTYFMQFQNSKNRVYNGEVKSAVDYGTKDITCAIRSGVTVNNVTFYPMIRFASDTDSTYEPYKETVSIITAENGLAGIPVDSGGNYTDQDGQQWICDEIVKYADGGGKRIRRIDSRTYDGVNNTCSFVNTSVAGGTETLVQFNLGVSSDWSDADYSLQTIMCDKFTLFYYKNASSIFKYGIRQSYSNGIPCVYVGLEDGITDVATANAWLQENNVTVYYILKEPIITDLSAEEIAEIEKLYTFYPVTNIFNDFDAGMKVKYKADAKNYIDKRLELLTSAIINTI